MFGLFRRRDRQPPPPWLMWVFIGFVAFAFINGAMREPREGEPNRIRESFRKARHDLNPDKLTDIEGFKNKVFHGGASLRSEDITQGTGSPAVCGQDVTIAYEATARDGETLADKATKEAPLSFRIGSGKVLPALDQGIIGMQEGGVRVLLAQPEMAYDAEGYAREDVAPETPVRFEVTLLGATPDMPTIDETSYRILSQTSGRGAIVRCGMEALVRLTVWSMEGKKLYETGEKQALRFNVGEGKVFMGLEQGVIGMRKEATRTLVVPPQFQRLMHGGDSEISIPFPKNETVLVDVTMLP